MINYFKSLFSKSVAVAVADFHKVVAKLEALEQHHAAQAQALEEKAAQTFTLAKEAAAEAQQAASIAAKVKALVS